MIGYYIPHKVFSTGLPLRPEMPTRFWGLLRRTTWGFISWYLYVDAPDVGASGEMSAH